MVEVMCKMKCGKVYPVGGMLLADSSQREFYKSCDIYGTAHAQRYIYSRVNSDHTQVHSNHSRVHSNHWRVQPLASLILKPWEPS